MPLLENIIATNNKQRFEFNDDKTRIRARQGHSIHVDVELKEVTPPDILYHGISEDVVSVILNEGLKFVTRLYVHLSSEIKPALKDSRRHGNPKVLKIETKAMRADGIRFYISNNGVWLTDYIPPEYILLID